MSEEENSGDVLFNKESRIFGHIHAIDRQIRKQQRMIYLWTILFLISGLAWIFAYFTKFQRQEVPPSQADPRLQQLQAENTDLQQANEALKLELEALRSQAATEPAEEPPVVEPSPPESQQTFENGIIKYRVQKGETLWRIATKVLGDGHLHTSIMEENDIADPSNLEAGMVLTIRKNE